jgi:hypothetical protein
MTKQEAITAMQRGEKVTHKYFSPDEWITINDYCQIEDESGYRHEQDSFWLDRGEQFDVGWELFEAPSEGENDVLHDVIKSVCDCDIPYFPTGNIKWCSKCNRKTVY